MIDWPGRVNELHEFLITEYALAADDRDVIELLTGLSLDLPGARDPAPRVILETDWMSRDCASAWFALGGNIVPRSMGILNGQRAPQARMQVEEWSARDRPAVFVDAEWRTPRRWAKSHSGTGYSLEESFLECLHLRVHSPKSLSVLQDTKAEARVPRLHYLTQKVVESRMRRITIPKIVLPSSYAYWCELACKLARPGTPWEWLVNAIAQVAVRRAYLYDRPETDAGDWRLAGRVLAWQVSPWTTELIARCSAAASQSQKAAIRHWKAYIESAGGKTRAREVRRELNRLSAAGVIRGRGPWYKGTEPDWGNVARLLKGRAFG